MSQAAFYTACLSMFVKHSAIFSLEDISCVTLLSASVEAMGPDGDAELEERHGSSTST